MKRSKDVFSLSERVLYGDFAIGSKDDIQLHLYVMPAASRREGAQPRFRGGATVQHAPGRIGGRGLRRGSCAN